MEPARQSQAPKVGQAIVLVILFAMLLFAVIWASMAWTSADGVEMSVHGWIALSLGVVFSLVIGCGLMVLMFYSSRSGYDETASPHFRPTDADSPRDTNPSNDD